MAYPTFEPPNSCHKTDSNRDIILKGEPISSGLFKANVSLLLTKVAEEARPTQLLWCALTNGHFIKFTFGLDTLVTNTPG
jgi:hypothetical protein